MARALAKRSNRDVRRAISLPKRRQAGDSRDLLGAAELYCGIVLPRRFTDAGVNRVYSMDFAGATDCVVWRPA